MGDHCPGTLTSPLLFAQCSVAPIADAGTPLQWHAVQDLAAAEQYKDEGSLGEATDMTGSAFVVWDTRAP